MPLYAEEPDIETTKLVDGAGINLAAISVAGALKVDNSAVTQPISGSVVANQGTPNTVGNSWPVKITDGIDALVVNTDGSINVNTTLGAPGVPIKIGVNYPQIDRILIPSGQTSLLLQTLIPSGQIWNLTDWDGSGDGTGFYQLHLRDDSGISETLVESCDSLTGWAKGGSVSTFVLESTIKTQGTNSINAALAFSAKGKQTGTLTKTFSPTVNLSSGELLKIDTYLTTSTVNIFIKISQGGNNYTFSEQLTNINTWTTLAFNLNEITSFDLTAVSSIQITFKENADTKINSVCYVDNIRYQTGAIRTLIDAFIAGQGIPHQQLFVNSLSLTGTGALSLEITVTNTDTAAYNYSVGFMGKII